MEKQSLPVTAVPISKYALTIASELLIAGLGLLTFRIVSQRYAAEGFGEYQLARGFVATLIPVATLGTAIGLTRFLAAAPNDRTRRRSLFAAAAIVSLFATLGGALLIVFGRRSISVLMFGGSSKVTLVTSSLLVLIGMAVHTVVYAYLRGSLSIGSANALQLMNLGLLPLTMSLLASDVTEQLRLTGLAITATSLIASLLAPGLGFARVQRDDWRMIGYSLSRVPGEGLAIGILVFPQTLVARFSGIEEAGAVGFAVSATTLLASLFVPIGVVLLPHATQLIRDSRSETLRLGLTKLLTWGTIASCTLAAIIALTADWAIRILIPDVPPVTGDLVRISLLGLPPYIIYVLARAAIEARDVRPVNVGNLALAAVLLVAVSMPTVAITQDPRFMAAAVVASNWALGLLTLNYLRKHRMIGSNASTSPSI